jgi:16S rRNA (cytosine1402-N4)-methyltransferase
MSPSAKPAGHEPVMLAEVVTALRPRPGGRYLDGTFGGGGHTRALLRASEPDGRVLALDADPLAVARGAALIERERLEGRLTAVQARFSELGAVAEAYGMRPLDGILLDLGFSSFQIDDPARGFAFRNDGPLDMRFDPTRGRSARAIVNDDSREELADILRRFGEERDAWRIAGAITRERERAPIETTGQLAAIVARAIGGRRGAHVHAAAKTFQALRIAVNGELDELERALPKSLESLALGGRLAVIAFHSLEDRIVKNFLREQSRDCVCPPEQPVCTCDHRPRLRLIGKAIRPTETEQATNPRSASAILRVAERTSEP